ncbi:TPA: glycosyltransferase family 2 protein, partial [Enterococcus faecium]|nr:glycosyltransferase family 2 protein [Enterococcus faecium]
IVPIYNVEKYLRKCVDSLLSQTLKEIEIVLVDDGSPDASGEIADEYQKKYSNVKTIHRENGGLGPARNTGIENATGEYVAFLDSDDWVESDMYEKLYLVASKENADIVVSGHCDFANDKAMVKKQHPLSGNVYDTPNSIKNVRKNLFGHSPKDQEVEAFPMSVCMSLYNKNLLDKYRLRFEKILSEDTIFNLNAYDVANKIAFTEYTDYCYRKEEQESITKSLSPNKQTEFKEFLITLKAIASKEDLECQIRAKRMAIDYCRLYVGLVDDANLGIKEKRKYIKKFIEDEGLIQCWKGYPTNTLPFQQKFFHKMLECKCYTILLLLSRI